MASPWLGAWSSFLTIFHIQHCIIKKNLFSGRWIFIAELRISLPSRMALGWHTNTNYSKSEIFEPTVSFSHLHFLPHFSLDSFFIFFTFIQSLPSVSTIPMLRSLPSFYPCCWMKTWYRWEVKMRSSFKLSFTANILPVKISWQPPEKQRYLSLECHWSLDTSLLLNTFQTLPFHTWVGHPTTSPSGLAVDCAALLFGTTQTGSAPTQDHPQVPPHWFPLSGSTLMSP